MTPARVLVVADRDVDAARIEARLRGRPDVRVAVGSTAALAPLIDEHSPSAVIIASTEARLASTLQMLADVGRLPPVVLLAGDPHAAWTPAARRATASAPSASASRTCHTADTRPRMENAHLSSHAWTQRVSGHQRRPASAWRMSAPMIATTPTTTMRKTPYTARISRGRCRAPDRPTEISAPIHETG